MPAVSSSPVSRFREVSVQSLPETVQLPRPPGIWTVPGAFVFLGPAGDARAHGRILLDMSTPAKPTPPGAERIIAGIMAAIVVWGLFHAVGAWTLNHDARRPLIVLACVAAFLGFWLALLAARRRRLERQAHLQDETRDQRR